MPSLGQDTVLFITVIISLCFSFCILLLAFWFKRADERLRLFAIAFLSVFISSAAAALSHDIKVSAVLSQYTDVLLLVLFTAILLSRSRLLVGALILLAPPALLALVFFNPSFVEFNFRYKISTALLTVLSLAIMYMHKNKKGVDSLLFWFILPMLMSGLAGHYSRYSIAGAAVPIFKLVSYSILLYFFYKSFVQALQIKFDENEKKLSSIDRSVETEVKKRLLELENINKKLMDISKIDALSNVLNKAAILKAIERLINDKPKSELTILMFDIDDFKAINDNHGHIVGDKCIRTLSSTARSNFRDIDLVGRYGGDEFIVVLPETGSRQAITIAERFRKIVAESTSPRFTISIGISSYPSDGTDVRSLIQEADKGLYVSKKKGKNAVSHSNTY